MDFVLRINGGKLEVVLHIRAGHGLEVTGPGGALCQHVYLGLVFHTAEQGTHQQLRSLPRAASMPHRPPARGD